MEPGHPSEKRRSTRIALRVPLRVIGTDNAGKSFTEETSSLIVNAHGGLVTLKQKLNRGQLVRVVNRQNGTEQECKVVIHEQADAPDEFAVGLEFTTPRSDFWPVAFPPDDWNSWAKELAEQILRQEDERRQAREKTEEKKKSFALLVPPFWAAFAAMVERDVKQFNAVLGEDPRHHIEFERQPPDAAQAPKRVIVARTPRTQAQLDLWLDLEAESIRFQLGRRAAHEAMASIKTGHFALQIEESGVITLSQGGRKVSLIEASQMLLKPVLAP